MVSPGSITHSISVDTNLSTRSTLGCEFKWFWRARYYNHLRQEWGDDREKRQLVAHLFEYSRMWWRVIVDLPDRWPVKTISQDLSEYNLWRTKFCCGRLLVELHRLDRTAWPAVRVFHSGIYLDQTLVLPRHENLAAEWTLKKHIIAKDKG